MHLQFKPVNDAAVMERDNRQWRCGTWRLYTHTHTHTHTHTVFSKTVVRMTVWMAPAEPRLSPDELVCVVNVPFGLVKSPVTTSPHTRSTAEFFFFLLTCPSFFLFYPKRGKSILRPSSHWLWSIIIRIIIIFGLHFLATMQVWRWKQKRFFCLFFFFRSLNAIWTPAADQRANFHYLIMITTKHVSGRLMSKREWNSKMGCKMEWPACVCLWSAESVLHAVSENRKNFQTKTRFWRTNVKNKWSQKIDWFDSITTHPNQSAYRLSLSD